MKVKLSRWRVDRLGLDSSAHLCSGLVLTMPAVSIRTRFWDAASFPHPVLPPSATYRPRWAGV